MSKDVIFNEGVLYKDKDTSSKAKKPELTPLNDLPKAEDEISGIDDQENENST